MISSSLFLVTVGAVRFEWNS